MSIRVLISNRVLLYAEGLRLLLKESADLQVTVLSCDRDRLQLPAADLIISDSAGFSRWAGNGRKILLICDAPQRIPTIRELKEMIEQGLAGIIDAQLAPQLLRKAVKSVHAGELWLDHRTIQNSLSTVIPSSDDADLSRRETEVLQLICAGRTNKEIADLLCISDQTVKTHCRNLFKKFRVSSRLQLAVRAGPRLPGQEMEML